MPRRIDLEKIRSKNPTLDWEKIREWQRLRRILLQRGLHSKRSESAILPEERRARIVDDPAHDSRVVRLQRY
jgi:hypothetical protein